MPYIVRTTWAGLQGGPGITQMAIESNPPGNFIDATQAQSVVNAIRAFWSSISNNIPNDVSLTVQPLIDFYVTADGTLGGPVSAATPPTAVQGGSAAAYSSASGAKIKLATNGIKNNRRVRGAIFLVPLTTSAYDTNGSVDSAMGTQVSSAWTTLKGVLTGLGLELGVWSRPIGTPPGVGGSFHAVSAVSVPSKVAVLRGRRD